ncbi:MAG: penicillin-binding protein, partial [Bacteroidota bacterium]|nr:penicillin-binding protein [Bacteroidota bacterium]
YVDNRSNITYDQLSPFLVKALVANEDERFYDHSGIDLKRTLAAIFMAGRTGGGSTITQQLAKNMFHKQAKNIVQRIFQKAKEYVIAVRLERRYTKEEIIAMYFNTFDFVNNAVGIQSASRVYFNKKPKDLKVEEAAMFVGMLQNPSYYNPHRFEKRTLERRATVLRKLMEKGEITSMQFDELKDKPIKLDFHPETPNDGLAPYFRMVLAEDLKKWAKDNKKPNGDSYNIYTDGLKIYTTIDTRMQRYAEEAANQHMTRYQSIFNAQFKAGWNPWATANGKAILKTACKYTDRWQALKDQGMSDADIIHNFQTQKENIRVFTYHGMRDTTMTAWDSVKYYRSFLQIGMMVVEPYTGYVRAWVGGPKFDYFKYDHCNVNTKRQVGSAFKPVQYALAVDNGWSPCMLIPTGPITVTYQGTVWQPRNSGRYGGSYPMKACLAHSINTAAAYMMKNFGPEALVDLAHKMGITTDIPTVPSICLGAGDVSLYEMMTVYSTFCNAGISTKPQYLLRIEDKDGNVIQNFTTEMKEVFSDNTAYKMCQLLKGPVSPGGTAARLRSYFTYPTDVGGKTGTTNKNTDAWFIGFTPQLLAGIWVGCDDPILHFLYTETGQGGHAAMPVWGYFMQKAYSDPRLALNKDAKFFLPSDSSLVKNVCTETGDALISGGNTGNWGEVIEENPDSEYGK